MSHFLDRRMEPKNKSAVNRQRFMRRYKEQIRKAVSDMASGRSIADMDNGGDVSIPNKDIREPMFSHKPGGDRETVYPGNKEFIPGDSIARPSGSGSGSGHGKDGAEGDGSDSFVFTLSREEFLDIFFDDLELPRLVRSEFGNVTRTKRVRAGYTLEGTPSNLAIARTLKMALSRRIALKGGFESGLAAAQAKLEEALAQSAGAEEVAGLEDEVRRLRQVIEKVPFIDELDLRYRNRISVPQPIARAVMFCLMDVSGSMDQDKKDLAKRFFALLYLFLSRKYEQVNVVFIRHTDNAEEVDEETFFHDAKSGGTAVRPALELMHDIAQERHPAETWNVYVAQASDGDAFGSDPEASADFLQTTVLPRARYYAYVEVPNDSTPGAESSLWSAYAPLQSERFVMRQVAHRSEIYPVFRGLFKKDARS